MAHYAFLNSKNIVVEIINGRDEDDLVAGVTDWEAFYAYERGMKCLRTSYTSRGGNKVDPQTGEVVAEGQHFRFNFAGIGYKYDSKLDAFIPPKPNETDNWKLNTATCLWELDTATQ